MFEKFRLFDDVPNMIEHTHAIHGHIDILTEGVALYSYAMTYGFCFARCMFSRIRKGHVLPNSHGHGCQPKRA